MHQPGSISGILSNTVPALPALEELTHPVAELRGVMVGLNNNPRFLDFLSFFGSPSEIATKAYPRQWDDEQRRRVPSTTAGLALNEDGRLTLEFQHRLCPNVSFLPEQLNINSIATEHPSQLAPAIRQLVTRLRGFLDAWSDTFGPKDTATR